MSGEERSAGPRAGPLETGYAAARLRMPEASRDRSQQVFARTLWHAWRGGTKLGGDVQRRQTLFLAEMHVCSEAHEKLARFDVPVHRSNVQYTALEPLVLEKMIRPHPLRSHSGRVRDAPGDPESTTPCSPMGPNRLSKPKSAAPSPKPLNHPSMNSTLVCSGTQRRRRGLGYLLDKVEAL
jgi:hypothetical protein